MWGMNLHSWKKGSGGCGQKEFVRLVPWKEGETFGVVKINKQETTSLVFVRSSTHYLKLRNEAAKTSVFHRPVDETGMISSCVLLPVCKEIHRELDKRTDCMKSYASGEHIFSRRVARFIASSDTHAKQIQHRGSFAIWISWCQKCMILNAQGHPQTNKDKKGVIEIERIPQSRLTSVPGDTILTDDECLKYDIDSGSSQEIRGLNWHTAPKVFDSQLGNKWPDRCL